MAAQALPRINIDFSQPGDRGDFHIDVFDHQNGHLICANMLPERRANLPYLYTARLIERGSHNPNDPTTVDKTQDRLADIVRYGQKLYNDLFGKDGKFQKYISKHEHLQNEIEVVLRLHSTASELWNIPWEYAHDGEKFLAIEGNYKFVRQPMDTEFERKLDDLQEIPHPLRILVVISDPQYIAPLNIDQEVRNIKLAVKEAEARGLIEVDFVEEGTLHNIDIALHDHEYHVLHYIGHGGTSQEGSFLVLEDEEGKPKPAFIRDLLPVIRTAPSLRLVFMNGCQTGRIDETEAMSGVATGLMQFIPAVVAMQFSINDRSAQLFAEAFYGAIGRGATLEEALHSSRHVMHQHNPKMADWAVPALYVHQTNMTLIDPHLPVGARHHQANFDLSELPQSNPFVGRRDATRSIRRAFPNLNIASAFIWGMAGMGKSSLARQVIERPGRRGLLSDVLVLRCEKLKPSGLIAKISYWLAQHFPRVGSMLADKETPLDQRIIRAARLIKRKRLVLVLDRFDTYLRELPDRSWDVPQPELAAYFYALAAAEWSVLTIFTSRYRWAFLQKLAEGSHVEVHLGAFDIGDIGRMMGQLENLSKVEQKGLFELFRRIGGHPATMRLVDEMLIKAEPGSPVYEPAVTRRLIPTWDQGFMRDLFNRLGDQERLVLMNLCILNGTFSTRQVQLMANLPEKEQVERIMARWEALSLANFVYVDDQEEPWYRIPNLVRTYVIQQLKPERIQKFHQRAAKALEESVYQSVLEFKEKSEKPFPPTKSKFDAALKYTLLGIDHPAPPIAQHYMDLALDWREHLSQSGNKQRAALIGTHIIEPLYRNFNALEMASKVLHESLQVLPPDTQERAQAELLELRMYGANKTPQENLRDYEALAETFAKFEDDENLSTCLGAQAAIYYSTGKKRKAEKLYDQAFKLRMKREDFVGAARMLLEQSRNATEQNTPLQALEYNQGAEKAIRKAENVHHSLLIDILTDRGYLLRRVNNLQEAYNCFVAAAEISQQTNDRHGLAEALQQMGAIMLQVSQLNPASQYALGAMELFEGINRQAELSQTLHLLCKIYAAQGEYQEAIVMGERALNVAEEALPESVPGIQSTLKEVRKKHRYQHLY